MVALFVVLTVVAFLTIDLILAARSQAGLSRVLHTQRDEENSSRSFVAGFEVASDRIYHAGHTWAKLDENAAARVGIDEFAARLIGRADEIQLVEPGTAIRQGQVIARLSRKGKSASVVAPISGVVRATNRAIEKTPGDVASAPFDGGWLVEIKGQDLRRDLRTLRMGAALHEWMDEQTTALHQLFAPEGAYAAAADGGRPVDAMSDLCDDETWRRARAQFLLTESD